MIERKTIHVCCAIIEHKGRVLAAQRGKSNANSGKWEFPGGKVEPYETNHQCINREIMEELSVTISVKSSLEAVTHCYPDKTICLHPFICNYDGEELDVKEHQQAGWFLPDELWALDWSEADVKVLKKYMGQFNDLKSPTS